MEGSSLTEGASSTGPKITHADIASFAADSVTSAARTLASS